jgi:hypothetical protein
MIYLLGTLQVLPDKIPEFNAWLGNTFVPLFGKYGARLVGSWVTNVGIRAEVTDLWCFDSMVLYEEAIRSLRRDKESREAFTTLFSITTNETTRFLDPLPCSPLK